ncbi:hypothetical protein GOBAR_DD21909 [Gossypium barbadense]|nr:hypothetical protein GOBAR_DD21909 [Gossypium barbadense]
MQHKPSYDPNLIPTLATNSNFDALPEAVLPAIPSPSLLYLSFNQDHGCFTVTNHGFWIYNCDPFRESFRRDFDHCSECIRVVNMLLRCYILALVDDRPNPQYPPNKVMEWDDNQNQCIGELSFCSEMRSVRLRRDRIVVVLEHKIFVYNFADLKLLHQIETIANLKGLCVVSQGVRSLDLVCPGLQKGLDGQLLATTSTKGTLVRVYNSVDGSLLQEWLAVSSDKGTVHVFGLKFNSGSSGSIRSQRVLPKCFSSEWLVAQFHLLEGSQYIVAFGHQKNTVAILGIDASFYKCQFDLVNGVEMTQLEYHNFVKPYAAF